MRRFLVLALLMLIGGIGAACDPLAPDPTSVALVRATPTPSPAPTAVPSRTPTRTPTPSPTHTPTITPTPLPTDTPPPTPFICRETQGQVVELTLRSEIAGRVVPYRAYLPPCYADSGKRYPYVILLHALDADYTQWIDLVKVGAAAEEGLALSALPPMILIMPDGGRLAAAETFRAGATWEDLILKELIPAVQTNFCTWEDRDGRAIGGISRGGFWAWSIGLRNPTLFSAVGGHSAAFYPDNAPASYNPMALARTVRFPPGQQPRLWLDVGDQDLAKENLDAVREAFAKREIDLTYTVIPGGEHTNAYWAENASAYLAFYGALWPKNLADLPSCLP